MYSAPVITLKYLKYLVTSSSGKGHGIHSPFVFDFIKNVLNDRANYPEYEKVEELRARLLSDETPVPLEDYGAGSAGGHVTRSVSAITAAAAKEARYGKLLFRMARYYQPHYIVELGTSLGISAAYLASADKTSLLVTGEGNYALASLAKDNLESIALHNVRIVTGNFNNTLPQIVGAIPHIDLAFIDGNHRLQPTLNYFAEMMKKVTPNSILVFDDIHWSGGMEAAWERIKMHPQVMLTVDLFFMGIVFLRPEFKVKQHFTIRF